MIKCRILFEKTGRAKYISHLDLMRTFQHAFIRSKIKIKHTEGFNPHPYISIALPLQLGCESLCEILDIRLDEDMDISGIPALLNPCLPEGIRAVSAFEPIGKVGEIKYTLCRVKLYYDDGGAEKRKDALAALFASKELVITKKTKRGEGELDLAKHISGVSVKAENEALTLEAVVSAVEPTVNPSNLVDAVNINAPELAPDFAEYMRIEVYNEKMQKFR